MAFLNLPPVPGDIAPALRDQIETYRVKFFAAEAEGYEKAFAIADDLAAFQPGNHAELTAKLMVALHQLAPGEQHDTLLNISTDDILSDKAERLLLACVNDGIRLASREQWDRNLAAYRAANAAFDEAANLYSLVETRLPETDPVYQAVDQHQDAMMKADSAAEKALLLTPAPDVEAVRVKAEIIETMSPPDSPMQAIVADLARLAAAA